MLNPIRRLILTVVFERMSANRRSGDDQNGFRGVVFWSQSDPKRKSRPPHIGRSSDTLMFGPRKLPPFVSVPYWVIAPRCSHGPGLRTAPLTLPAASRMKAIRV